jgi:hypothetical protein
MGDSWEDEDSSPQQPPRSNLNPKAPSFTFNPGARSFVPAQNVAVAATQPAQAPYHPSPVATAEHTEQGSGASNGDVDMLDAQETGPLSKDVEMETAVVSNGPEAGEFSVQANWGRNLGDLEVLGNASSPDFNPVSRIFPGI